VNPDSLKAQNHRSWSTPASYQLPKILWT